MKNLLVLVLLVLSLYSSELFNTDKLNPKHITDTLKEIDSDEIIKIGSDYLKNNTQRVTDVQKTMETAGVNTYKTIKSKIRHLNIQEVLGITYEVRVLCRDGVLSSNTAVALSSNGKLITAYSNINNYKTIVVIDTQGREYTPVVGNISIKNDLAYLYIKAKNLPYARLSSSVDTKEDLYIVSYEKLLQASMASQVKPDAILLNTKAQKGASGGGIFNEGNELVSILIANDTLDKTAFSTRVHTFSSITQKFQYKN